MFDWNEYFAIRNKYFGENKKQARKSFEMYRKTLQTRKDSLADCTEATVPTPAIDWSGYQEGINPMNYANVANAVVTTAPTEVQEQRKYLEKRLSDVYYTKRDPLEKMFGLRDDNAPQGAKEFKERLEAGKFQIRGVDIEKERSFDYWHWTDLIRWRDPAMKADQEGFDAARKELKAKRQAAQDIIKIGDVADGLKAIQDLESWEPTGAAS